MAVIKPPMNTPEEKLNLLGWTCPRPLQNYPAIVMGHGAGGRMMADLIEHLFAPAFDNEWLGQMGDSTVLPSSLLAHSSLAFTTDSFVVSPLFFPGGNIGELAVYGTVNDLAMRGARPLFLSAGFILEEGLPMQTLGNIVTAMAAACRKAGVKIATGDTKVVQKGHGDGIYINTSGIGVVPAGVDIGPANARPGDAVLVSGTLGDHGIAIMSVREGLTFQTEIQSDIAPLNSLVEVMIEACRVGRRLPEERPLEERLPDEYPPELHCLRDATRGGLAAVLNELAGSSKVGIEFDERKMPLRPEVNAACEMLGLDPLYVANEGKLVAIVPGEAAEAVLGAMRQHEYGKEAAIIGRVVADHAGLVTAKTSIGGMRVVDVPAGELLPRIC
jgi:hydrogenase expression/formation protein HypE